MLPDFPLAKDAFHRGLLHWTKEQMLLREPILREISPVRQHEGQTSRLTRADGSSRDMGFEVFSHEAQIIGEDIRQGRVDRVYEMADEVATAIAGRQVALLLERVGEAANEVGNVIKGTGEITQEQFLQLLARVRTEFDPATLEPTGQCFVVDPETGRRLAARVKEWEADPSFVEQFNASRRLQLEAWRAREDSRKLVD
jgi:hypothetical protein